MSSQPLSFLTPEEYLAIERKAERRSEFLNGEVFAMSGASTRHRNYDRGTKLPLYRQLASIEECLLVAQERVMVEHYLRQPNGDWLLSERLD